MSPDLPRARINQFYPFKKKRSEKDHKPSFSRSPKGSLAGFLVKSPDGGTQSTPTDASSRLNIVKRNLALEIGLSATGKLSLPSPESIGESRNEESICKDNKGALYEALVSRELIRVEAPSNQEVNSVSNGSNQELKKFANDFLSLYCSDLQSTLPETKEVKGKKRDGSPFLLSTCSKKLCVMDGSDKKKNTSDNGYHKNDLVFNACKEVDEADISHVSLKRCSEIPDINAKKDVLTALALCAKTPKSPSKSSKFSPGEEFWNEAFQVADGLDVPMPERSQISIDERPRKTFLKDASSCIAAQNSEYLCKLEIGKKEDQKADGKAFVKPKDAATKEVKNLPYEIRQNGTSPLPIRHFDFIHEERNNDKGSDLISLKGANSAKDLKNDQSLIDKSCGNAYDKKKNSSNSHLLNSNASNFVSIGGKGAYLGQANGANLPSEVLHEKKDDGILGNGSNTQVFLENSKTPASSDSPTKSLHLCNWLPFELVAVYSKKGITKLYPWQVECLHVDGVLERSNLVYCASTSAGKSFVAEILMLRRVIATGKMAFLVLPYVSICAEKAEHLEQLLEPLGKHVRSFYGSQGGGSLPKDTSVAVCTIEKANSLINRLLEEGRLSEVGIIVIDELHMVGDQHRGYLLELMLTKLRYAAGEGVTESCSEEGSSSSSGKTDAAFGLQIVGMSATMPNLSAVADWLHEGEQEWEPLIRQYFHY